MELARSLTDDGRKYEVYHRPATFVHTIRAVKMGARYPCLGNDPSTEIRCVLRSRFRRASTTGGSSRCPSNSMKKKYSEGLFGFGNDSIQVRLRRCFLKEIIASAKAPGACFNSTINVVLSLPVGLGMSLPRIANLVTFPRRSSIYEATAVNP